MQTGLDNVRNSWFSFGMSEHTTTPSMPTTGQYQSPISLIHQQTFHVDVPGYLTINYDGAPFPGQFLGASGHRNFVIDPRTDEYKRTIRLGLETAVLEKIHLHMPSEHDLEGQNHPGEVHLIHRINDPKRPAQLIVLGCLLGNAVPDFPRNEVFSQWAQTSTAQEISLDPRKLLPNTDKWYRYEGSLTTEPYSEIVSWLVFGAPLYVGSMDLALLASKAHQPEREPQPIDRRFVLRNFE